MESRTIFMALFALVFGLSAAWGVYSLDRSKTVVEEAETVDVVVAKTNVPRGKTVTFDTVEIRKWPKNMLLSDAVVKLDDAMDRTVAIPLVKGEPLLQSKLTPKGAGRGMAALIPPGMRAFTIQSPNVATGVAGFILPGNKVDILLTFSDETTDRSGGGSTLTLLQNVEILAVDHLIDAPDENRIDPKDLRSVTLLVSPSSAARLTLGQNKGTLQLSLRNPEDDVTDEVEQATLKGIRGDKDEPVVAVEDPTPTPVPPPALLPPPPPEPVVHHIRTLRGTQSGILRVQYDAVR